METINLFGPKPEPKTQKICIRSIRAVFNNEVIREHAPVWVSKSCTSAEHVFELFRDLAKETKENFVALHLDTKNRIICYDTVSIGSLNASVVHPREVYKTVLLSSAAAVLFIHNHPSGDTAPSREDIEITKRLKDAGELLGIRVLDHLIVGEAGYYSFANDGIL
ncbi:JAB domain-containing protein [Geopsychrobacter electrodiphilus]|uniref:JAB domain-containing protein n=1 Tax=Geopsychrobacter electrodiphilus TaxID=225196 RepID=UPI0003780DE2|nr:DNA repair protein RadC [Geopsychrobacter electrodiphilus]